MRGHLCKIMNNDQSGDHNLIILTIIILTVIITKIIILIIIIYKSINGDQEDVNREITISSPSSS